MKPENADEVVVVPIPALRDNYIWLLRRGRWAAVVDPGESAPVFDYLACHGLELVAILVTHHHADHVGGIAGLREGFPKARVYGPAKEAVVGVTHLLGEGERLELPEMDVSFQVLEVSGHTRGHVAYYEPNLSGVAGLFCGDVLFSAGCGRLFEGSPEQMQHALARLRALPAETRIYCAHEYTEANLRFAQRVEPANPSISEYAARVAHLRTAGLPSLPTTLATECRINPFLRWDSPCIQAAAEQYLGHAVVGAVAVFAAIRAWRNDF